jgi:phosphoglycolate phosphatase
MVASLPTPRAIIFDWDNTLVDTWPVIHAALVATFEAMGHTPWTLDDTKARVKKSMRDSFPELFGTRWEEAAQIYQKSYKSQHLHTLQALPGARDVLEAVRSLGLYNVVVSNKKGPTLRDEATHMGWAPLFDALVGADDAARDKPFADPVALALQASPVQAGESVWFVGDSDVDLECASNTGCTAILYGDHAASGKLTSTHFHGAAYHAHVLDHQQLLAALKR